MKPYILGLLIFIPAIGFSEPHDLATYKSCIKKDTVQNCSGTFSREQKAAQTREAEDERLGVKGTLACRDAWRKSFSFCENFFGAMPEDQRGALSSVLNQSTVLTVGSLASPMLTAVSMTFGNDIKKTCEMSRTLSTSMMALNGTFAATCGWASRSCISTCLEETGPTQEDNQHTAGRCRNMGDKVSLALQQAMLAFNSMLGSQACINSAEANERSNQDLCSRDEYRNSPVCTNVATDCNQPANASTCYCILRSNPNDSRCVGVASNDNPLGNGYFGGGTSGSSPRDVSSDLGDLSPAPTSVPRGTGSNAAESRAAPGGPPISPGGGGLAGNDDNKQAAGGQGKGPFNTDIDHGTGRRGSIASIGGAAAYNSGESGDGKNKGGMPDFDLRKYLPKTNPNLANQQRGIAGMSLRAVDGLTGPFTNIFMKVSKQYSKQVGTLNN